MIESIKAKVWDILKNKGISLAMIYDSKGRILWNKGRRITGKTINLGDGFCKSVIKKSMADNIEINKQDQYITFSGEEISKSAKRLMIKHIIIQPVADFFLYIDSGNKINFTEVELKMFKMLAELLGEAIDKIKRHEQTAQGISGNSPSMRKVKELILKYSLEEDCILLLGETGVGKTHTAELIHRYSGRKGRFIVADTTTINENLFESEIFGHKKGAFTGAIENKRGLIEEAEGGTLFIDEISEVQVSCQAKLMRFIEAKKYRVLGDEKEREADVRILAASNRDLQQWVKDKKFREDLYYRINVLEIKIPPLRDRIEDIEEIVEQKKRYLKGKEIGHGFWETLKTHDWPGNYRELFSVLKRVGILCESPITGKDLHGIIAGNPRMQMPGNGSVAANRAWEEMRAGKDFWVTVKQPYLNRDLNRSEVQEIISAGLSESDGKYKNLLVLFNLETSDYHRFMRFIHEQQLSPTK